VKVGTDPEYCQRVDERLAEPLESCEYLFLWSAGASAVDELRKRHPLPSR